MAHHFMSELLGTEDINIIFRPSQSSDQPGKGKAGAIFAVTDDLIWTMTSLCGSHTHILKVVFVGHADINGTLS